MKSCIRFSITFFLLLSGMLSAQNAISIPDVVKAIREVNKTFLETKNIQMNVGYSLFPDYTSANVFEQEAGVFMKQGTSTYSNLLGITSLRNNRVSLTLDSNEQSIVIADAPSKNEFSPSLVDLDSVLKICNSAELHDLGTQKLYKLRFDKTPFFEYNTIDIYVNSETHFLERLVLYFRAEVDLDETDTNDQKSKPRLEIVYSGINISPVFVPAQFSESKFISGSGSKIICVPSYANFRLVNNKLH